MKKIFVRITLLLIFAGLFSCSPKKEAGKNGKIKVIYSGNVGARYDPCGCRIPLGGLARRSSVVDAIKSNFENTLILDSGALIFEKYELYPPYESTMRMTAHLMIDMLNQMDMDAVNVSRMDLADSPDSLFAMDKRSNWPWLSANLVWKQSQELVFTPHMIKTIDGFRVGVFGIMGSASMGITFFEDDDSVAVLDPKETIRKEIKALNDEGAEIIIALAYMDKNIVDSILGEIPGIHLLIYGHTREHNPGSDPNHFQPYKINETIVARCPDGGRVLGVMDLEIWNGSTVFEQTTGNVDLRPEALKQTDDPEDKKSRFFNQFIHLDPKIKRDRAIQDQIDDIGGKIEEYRKLLRKESEEK